MIYRVVDTIRSRERNKIVNVLVLPEKNADGSCDKSRKRTGVSEGGFYDLVCADVPLSPPPLPSELMRGFLMLFLASWSWRAVGGCRREREGKQEKERRAEEVGVCGGGGGGGFPCGLQLQHQHKDSRCEGSGS